MNYKATLCFKDGISSEQRDEILVKISNAGGEITSDLYDKIRLIDVVQAPTHNCAKYTTGPLQPLNESLVSKGATSSEIANYFSDNMPANDNDYTLTIIDSYFFAERKDDEITDCCIKLSAILQKYPAIKEIRIVRCEQKDEEKMKNAVSGILKSNHQVSIAHSDDFHDRFWIISDNKGTHKGIVVGTSLNGLAKKIFLIGPLDQDDITDILTEVNKLAFH